ncbi:MAG: hypothetical protein R2752_13545 [Vicinamibacterales bacterium]
MAGNAKVSIQLPPLSPELRGAFQKFYQDAYNGVEPSSEAFDEAALRYFDHARENPDAVDQFFEAFTLLWNERLRRGEFGRASDVWTWALRPALAWETQRSGRLHKGAAFYFAAMTEILAGDLVAGYLYAHRALEEDRLTHRSATPQTPSLSLVAIDAENTHQAFRGWVMEKARFLEAALATFRRESSRRFGFKDLRSKFLGKPEFVEPTFLFSYSIARLRRLESLMPGGSDSDFAAQLRLNILFDLTLVIDHLLRPFAPGKWQFIELAEALSSRAQLAVDRAGLQAINGGFREDFAATMAAVLEGRYRVPSGQQLSGAAKDLAVAYGCRNRGAHHLSGGAVVSKSFGALRQSLLNTVFLAVDSLPA